MPSLTEVIAGVVALLAGGFAAWERWGKQRAIHKREETEFVITKQQELLDRVEMKLEAADKKLEESRKHEMECREEVGDLRARVEMLERTVNGGQKAGKIG